MFNGASNFDQDLGWCLDEGVKDIRRLGSMYKMFEDALPPGHRSLAPSASRRLVRGIVRGTPSEGGMFTV